MKQTSARFLLSVLGAALFVGVAGCRSTPKPVDPVASDYLGPAVVHVLQRPLRTEGWNFQRPDMTIASDPPVRDLDPTIGQDLAAILSDGSTFSVPARGGAFEKAVGYKIYGSGGESVEVYLSFNNDQALIRHGSYTNQPGAIYAGVTAARQKLLALTRRAFPDYKAPAK
jgi:hypothetical protein